MMNKSKIDWCDFTWNPVTGCTRGCEYCYAAKQARRFCGDVRLNLTSPRLLMPAAGPIFWSSPSRVTGRPQFPSP